ncbi:hypothetical protein CCAX7_21710 [Capsulimonas corticalis]|uniref:Carbohydrate-binding module family 96 domain-containing protein n=1 Tax=Capsulimonas corticalis TaxID=2219043 RepID=A0A402D257_9BACT|nr:DNRLRE domain-containing protein [Capsulimonas corticalis]BDI30120.1 hypothetical protein CCAX7_21710 [Capsulimonas corticalis]
MSLRKTMIAAAALGALAAAQPSAHAQTSDQIIYDDSLENGWLNYGWATLNYGSAATVQGGSKSISVTAGAYQALYVHHTAIDSSNYTAVSFWINGGPTGGQKLAVYGLLNGAQKTAVAIPALAANTWTQVTVPLSALGVDDKLTLDGFWISDVTGKSQPTFYVDNITLIGSTVPARTSANIFVDNNTVVRTMDARLYGMNTAVWDQQLSTQSTRNALTSVGAATLRFPGGSTSDAYNWSTGKSDGGTSRWASTFPSFMKVAEATNAQPYITVDYGSGTPQMAAAWVAYANGDAASTQTIGTDTKSKDWKTVGFWAGIRGAAPLATDDGYNFLRVSHPAPFGVKYWEIGNECYGSWENDKHGASGSGLSGSPHDPYYYAIGASQFLTKMRSVDPTIKVGVVVSPGIDSYPTVSHPSLNLTTGDTTHHGWAPVVLYNLRKLYTLPDFLIYHRYAQSPGYESDDSLLLTASGWDAPAANLRQILTDYVGPISSSIELAATETNSVSSSPGKQSVSLVNGLFLADNTARVAQTEFNACLWWDLHNSSQTGTNMNPSLYGWRKFGDYGILSIGDRSDTPVNTPYPTFRALELLTHWARGGDSVLTTTSDYNKLSAYGARLQTGELALLVINKSAATPLTGNITLGSFLPDVQADVYQYGMDEDASGADLTHGTIPTTGTSLAYTFAPYSMTVIVLPPAPGWTPVTTPAPTSTTLAPIEDSYVISLGSNSVKHGAETQITVKRDSSSTSTYRRTAYLKFDLTNLTGPITSAQLSLTGNANSSKGQAPLCVYGVSDTTWTESTLVWSSALASGGLTSADLSTGTLAAVTQVNGAPGVYTWDLTSYLADKAGKIVTLQVSDPGTDGLYFCFNSKEATSGQPALTVTTTPSSGATPIIPVTPTDPAPTVLNLAPVADSYVNSLAADTVKHGAETQITVKRDSTATSIYHRTAYLKFDLTGVTSPITSAQLALTLNSNGTAGKAPLSVYGIGDTSWTESTLTWNSALAAGWLTAADLSTGTLAATTQVTSTPGVYTWDLTSYLADKIGQIVTLQVSDPGTDGVYFCFNSKEATSGQPVLTIQE